MVGFSLSTLSPLHPCVDDSQLTLARPKLQFPRNVDIKSKSDVDVVP